MNKQLCAEMLRHANDVSRETTGKLLCPGELLIVALKWCHEHKFSDGFSLKNWVRIIRAATRKKMCDCSIVLPHVLINLPDRTVKFQSP